MTNHLSMTITNLPVRYLIRVGEKLLELMSMRRLLIIYLKECQSEGDRRKIVKDWRPYTFTTEYAEEAEHIQLFT